MQLRLSYIRRLVFAWLAQGGQRRIELAALEPLLWHEGDFDLADLVKELKELGCQVSLTTNGSFLAQQAESLKQAGIDLVRLSWHTLDRNTFCQITGQDAYPKFKKGLETAVEIGLPLAINRVLLKGHCHDLAEQVDFINQHQLRLKLLDLYWMPSMAAEYDRFYISPIDAITQYIKPEQIQLSGRVAALHNGRGRVRYHTQAGGVLEYKLGAEASRHAKPCQSCTKRADCLEGFGDYLRVFPDETVSLCYMRPDLSQAMPISDMANLPAWLAEQNVIGDMPLRLVLTSVCNFNCGFPGSTRSWCLKQGRGFSFPPRRPDRVCPQVIPVVTIA